MHVNQMHAVFFFFYFYLFFIYNIVVEKLKLCAIQRIFSDIDEDVRILQHCDGVNSFLLSVIHALILVAQTAFMTSDSTPAFGTSRIKVDKRLGSLQKWRMSKIHTNSRIGYSTIYKGNIWE